MSHRILIGLLLATGCATTATPPTASGGSNVTELHVDGIEVIVQRNPGSDLSAARLFIRGGARNWNEKTSGLEQLALQVAADGGTTTLDKDAFAQRLAHLGSTVGASTAADYSSFAMKSLTNAWDPSFDLMVDAFLHPALPAVQLEIERQLQLSQLRHEQESPDGRLSLLSLHQVFHGHPYENRAVGTIENVTGFQLADLQTQLAKLRERRRLVLVVVGDIDPAHVAEQVHRAFGALPEGTYQETPYPSVSFAKPALQGDTMPIPTNYIQAVAPGPRWSDPDFAAAIVAMDVLSWREFREVRTKRNLSYAPHAGFRYFQSVPVNYLYVTAVEPTKTMQVMVDEVKTLATTPVDEGALEASKSTFRTSLLMGADTVSGEAGMLGAAWLLGGDWHLAQELPERVKRVTAPEVQAYAQKLAHFQTSVVGDASKLDPAILP